MHASDTANLIDLAVYGCGGFGRELAWLAATPATGRPHFRMVAFVDDDPERLGRTVGDWPVLTLPTLIERHPGAQVSIGAGAPKVRETLAGKLDAAGVASPLLIDASVRDAHRSTYGDGTVICAGSILTCDVTLGRHVQINLDCTIGHDAVLEDFVTLAPGVHVSGWVRIERGAYIGTGASIINGVEGRPLVVGAGATVGAGAVVTRAVEPGSLVVGVPAKAKLQTPTATQS